MLLTTIAMQAIDLMNDLIVDHEIHKILAIAVILCGGMMDFTRKKWLHLVEQGIAAIYLPA